MKASTGSLAHSLARPYPLAFDEVHCWCARLDVVPETRARLYATLSVDERERAAHFRFPRDQQRFIVAHGVLRDVLGRYLPFEPGDIRYVYNTCGKPDLDPTFGSRLRFNLSHSADLALIAITAGSSVGVDLESIQDRYDYAELARHFFSTAEVEQLNALPSDLYAEAVIGCWTKKEACLKAGGGGLTIPLNSFAVPLTTRPDQGPADLDMALNDFAPPVHWSVHTLKPAPGYIGALAVEGKGGHLRPRQWRMPRG